MKLNFRVFLNKCAYFVNDLLVKFPKNKTKVKSSSSPSKVDQWCSDGRWAPPVSYGCILVGDEGWVSDVIGILGG